MDAGALILIQLALPALFAAACLVLRSPKAVLATVALGALVMAASTGATVWAVHVHGTLGAVGEWFFLDALSAYHLVLLSIVFGLSSLYSWKYFAHPHEKARFDLRTARRFGALWFGAAAAMTLVLESNNLGILWVGVEASTLLTAFLICLHVSPASLEAMWKYLIMCSVGVAFAFIGTLLVSASAAHAKLDGSDALLWTHLKAVAGNLNPTLLKMGFIFLLVGYGTKAGLAPMHGWLPDAHSQAPAPVSAVFSGFLLNSALYCIMRYIPIVEAGTGHVGWGLGILTLFGLASILIAAGFIVFQNDAKRLLAYSSVEHMGIIAVGLGLGGFGVFAAMFHAANHSIAKPLGFFSAGRLGQMYGTHDMTKMKGVLRVSPVWGGGFFFSLLALIGVAPFAIFMSEFQILRAAFDTGALVTLALFVAGTCIVFVGALRHAVRAAWEPADEAIRPEPAGALDIALVFLPLAAMLAFGLFLPSFASGAFAEAAKIIGGTP